MKKLFFVLLFLSGTFMACQDDETLELADENSVEFKGKSALIKSQNLSNVRFKEVPGSIILDEAIPKGEICVDCPPLFY